MLHDIHDPGDPYPTCCAEDCRCGHPGDAVLQRHDDGTITVVRADPVIRVSRELLGQTSMYGRERETLQLDTAGEYVYAYLRPDPRNRRVAIFGRVK
jgi:hypothetical protein